MSIYDDQRNADYLDSMAESEPEEIDEDSDWAWGGIEEISNEERNACDLYNERYVMSYCD
jgi:hypothetical protein